MNILEFKNVGVSYGAINALNNIDISVEKGKIVALLGANGAGKSTLLKAISGLVPTRQGEILFNGSDISKLSTEKIVKLGIVQSPEGRQIFPELTVEENLVIGAFSLKDRNQIKENLKMVYSYFERLEERKKQNAGTLSGGEQQMLAIGRALMANPEVLLLDEPSLGLAPLIIRDIFEIVKKLNDKGTTVLIVEQNAKQTLKLSDYAYVLEVGSIINQGKSNDLLHDPKIIDAYLGGH